ncbi:MAG: hypothetical protein ACUVXF_04705 [Desulfobaccales bacterium]
MVTVDPPLSAAEQEFLKDVREYVHKLFFVLNKIDYVAEAERREALEFTTQVLTENLGKKCQAFSGLRQDGSRNKTK